jgi:hypothetical protein
MNRAYILFGVPYSIYLILLYANMINFTFSLKNNVNNQKENRNNTLKKFTYSMMGINAITPLLLFFILKISIYDDYTSNRGVLMLMMLFFICLFIVNAIHSRYAMLDYGEKILEVYQSKPIPLSYNFGRKTSIVNAWISTFLCVFSLFITVYFLSFKNANESRDD